MFREEERLGNGQGLTGKTVQEIAHRHRAEQPHRRRREPARRVIFISSVEEDIV